MQIRIRNTAFFNVFSRAHLFNVLHSIWAIFLSTAGSKMLFSKVQLVTICSAFRHVSDPADGEPLADGYPLQQGLEGFPHNFFILFQLVKYHATVTRGFLSCSDVEFVILSDFQLSSLSCGTILPLLPFQYKTKSQFRLLRENLTVMFAKWISLLETEQLNLWLA